MAPSWLSVVDFVETQVLRVPDLVAVEHGSLRLTYRQLDQRANAVAVALRKRGVGPDVPVAICVPRLPEMTVAVLGVLKAGGAYLPLDPAYPSDRLAFMLSDARPGVVLVHGETATRLPETDVPLLRIDLPKDGLLGEVVSPPARTLLPEHMAYLIYTSGSTGRPKGVAMVHRALANLMQWQFSASAAGQGDKTLQFAPLGFDVSFQEMFATWGTAGTLVLAGEEMRADPLRLVELLAAAGVRRLFLPFVALQQLAEVAVRSGVLPTGLREIVTAGEQLRVTRQLREFFERMPACSLQNQYGPSETHVVTSYTLTGPPAAWPALPPIGKALPHVTTQVLDTAGQPVAPGAEGELYIGGVALARGYLNRPDLTEARFVVDRASADPSARLYRTGDLVRVREDGEIEFLGRADDQVKVRGYRIELGEVEASLGAHPAVVHAAVSVREDEPGEKRLIAYFVAEPGKTVRPSELRRHLLAHLPEYMVPTAFVPMAELPRTPSGKVDRRALPRPDGKRPELDQPYEEPRGAMEETIAKIWRKLLTLDRVGAHDSFFDLGGTSILAVEGMLELRQALGREVAVVKLFQHPTVRALARHLATGPSAGGAVPEVVRPRGLRPAGEGSQAVAIVGMAGRFPGAPDLHTLWKNLCDGRESISFFRADEIDARVDSSHPGYVRARGILEDAEAFDATFFGESPRLADITDPQQRVFLQVAWHAFEDAGVVPRRYPGAIGVFAGVGNNTYHTQNVLPRTELVDQVGAFQIMAGNEKDYVATRVAFKLNLRGPALSIHTACSTSLVATCVAVQSLLDYGCDVALAGGASVTVPIKSGHIYNEGGMLSADGHTRSFDADGTGTVFSDGAGAVVLKRLEDALADGDRIYAVIRGVATNNDGADKASFTAPSVAGQVGVIAAAQAMAQFPPETMSYVETHGTATPLGDPIEIEALTEAFAAGTDKTGFCAIGSIKSNLGHLTAASGVAGLIKTALAIHHGQLPPSLHFNKPNPHIDFARSPFFVQTKLGPWPPGRERRAGVSSFGVGGTNAHVVLEAPPPTATAGPALPQHLLVLSAKSGPALEEAAAALATALNASDAPDLADVAFTLQTRRTGFAHRRFGLCRDRDEALTLLAPNAVEEGKAEARVVQRQDPEVAFLFPGQGAQHPDMARTLYQDEPVVRRRIDQCAEILQPKLGLDLRTLLFPVDGARDEAERQLQQTRITQPALFTVEYALAELWQSWGVRPAAMLGHSVGEYVAACLASVFSLEDALEVVANRGRLVQAQPAGSMLSVRAPAADVEPRLPATLSLAASNGPRLCVVSGPTEAVQAFQATLENEKIPCRFLQTSHAFHSAMMDSVVEPVAAVLGRLHLHPPKLRFVSSVTGTWITEAQATDPHYWARHLREPVRFAEGVRTLWSDPTRVLLEVGPRATATTMARQAMTDPSRQLAIATLGDEPGRDADWAAVSRAMGRLWLGGVDLDWGALHAGAHRRVVSLPGYPFEKKRHWIDPPAASQPMPEPAALAAAPVQPPVMETPVTQTPTRRDLLLRDLRAMIEEASGLPMAETPAAQNFLDAGLDSLLLTQLALALQRRYKTGLTFRQLLESVSSLGALSDYLEKNAPAEALPAPAAPAAPAPSPIPAAAAAAPAAPAAVFAQPMLAAPGPNASVVEQVIHQQLQVMAAQLAALGGGGTAVPSAPPVSSPAPAATPVAVSAPAPTPAFSPPPAAAAAEAAPPKPFGAQARIDLTSGNMGLSDRQQAALQTFIGRYTSRTPKSKAYAQQHRAHLADPRTVSGFRPLLKEITYPIVVNRSQGARLWDLDGHEYIDLTCGFGSCYFGHSAPFIADAVRAQIERGFEIGPQNTLAGEVAELLCELVGMERAAFCNTGSEAVLGTMRLARTVTGRPKIVIFEGAYHGIFDEVIVRGSKSLRSFPATAGITPAAVENIVVLEYGSPASLEAIDRMGDDVAAVLVETVQSRRPDFQPAEFLSDLRKLTERRDIALIFDEVITGFRLELGGAQARFGVRADMATYGKVIGGGMPIGAIAGSRRYMDALDGGFWRFGDASFPEAGVTYFAGTFIRHPLALAAAKASLEFLKAKGPSLQQEINARADRMLDEIRGHLDRVGAPVHIKNCGSLFKLSYDESEPLGTLLFHWLRHKGVHIWDGRPCFLTLAHGDSETAFLSDAFRTSVDELQAAELLSRQANGFTLTPPVPGARQGKDHNGDPAWFVPDPDRPGKYLRVEQT